MTGTRALRDGDVIAFDRARLACRVTGRTLAVRIDWIVTAGDTAPPDLEELARGGRSAEIAITPIAFKPRSRDGSALRPQSLEQGRDRRRDRVRGARDGRVVCVHGEVGRARYRAAVDALSLPSTLFKLKVGDRFLLRSGSHRVEAELPGYYPLDTEIEVGSLSDQTIALTLTKLPGLVTITTEPEVGAQVSLDGTVLGTTPLVDTELTPGVHRLEFARLGTSPRCASSKWRRRRTPELSGDADSRTRRSSPCARSRRGRGARRRRGRRERLRSRSSSTAGEHELEVRLAGYNAWSRPDGRGRQRTAAVAGARTHGRRRTPRAREHSERSERQRRRRVSRPHAALVRLSPGVLIASRSTKPGYETAATRSSRLRPTAAAACKSSSSPQLGEVRGRRAFRRTPRSGSTASAAARRRRRSSSRRSSQAIEIRLTGYAARAHRAHAAAGLSAEARANARAARRDLGRRIRAAVAYDGEAGAQAHSGGPVHDGLVAARARPALERGAAARARHARVLSRRRARSRTPSSARFKPEHDSGEFTVQSLNGDDQPVTNVSWEDAAQYLNWLSIQDGLQPVYEPNGERLGCHAPAAQRLPLADRGGVGVGRALRGTRDGACCIRGAPSLPPPDRSGNYADVSAASILPTVLVTYTDGYPGHGAARHVCRERGRAVRSRRQRRRVDSGLLRRRRRPRPTQRSRTPSARNGDFHVVRGSSWRSATVTDLRLAYRDYGHDPRDDVGFRIARNV